MCCLPNLYPVYQNVTKFIVRYYNILDSTTEGFLLKPKLVENKLF